MTHNKPFTKQQIRELPYGFTPSGNDQNRKQRRNMMKTYFNLLKKSKG